MQKLIDIETQMLAVFRRLSVLEIVGRKNDKEYLGIMEDLKKKITIEENLIQSLNSDFVSISIAIEKVMQEKTVDETVKVRLFSRFGNIMMTELTKGDLKDKAIDAVLKEGQDNVFMFQTKFLRDAILEEQDENIRTALIMNYYEMCYMYPKLSELFIDDNFDLNNDCFNSYYLVADINKLDRNKAQSLVDNYCAELAMQEVSKIFYYERFVNSKTVGFNKKMAVCIFKGLECMLSSSRYEATRKSILHSIEENNLRNHPNYDFVISLFSNPNRPKGSARTITLGKPLK